MIFFSHFPEWEIEAQRGKATCPAGTEHSLDSNIGCLVLEPHTLGSPLNSLFGLTQCHFCPFC